MNPRGQIQLGFIIEELRHAFIALGQAIMMLPWRILKLAAVMIVACIIIAIWVLLLPNTLYYEFKRIISQPEV